MLLAIPSMVGGTVIIRKKLLVGFGRWSVFLSGAFMVFVVTPALITGRGPIAYLALPRVPSVTTWLHRSAKRSLAVAGLLVLEVEEFGESVGVDNILWATGRPKDIGDAAWLEREPNGDE